MSKEAAETAPARLTLLAPAPPEIVCNASGKVFMVWDEV